MKVAIIHDWLTVYAGAEKTLEQILTLYPEADIFTIVDFLPQKDRDFLDGHKITTSFIQKLPECNTISPAHSPPRCSPDGRHLPWRSRPATWMKSTPGPITPVPARTRP